MTRRTTADVEAAKRLIDRESAGADGDEGPASAAARVYTRLSERLSPLIGKGGHRALVARSVTLIKREFPCFERFVVDGDPSVDDAPGERLRACLNDLDPPAASAAAVALYGTILGLLTAFIGEQLVRRVLPSAFPAIETGPKETEE